MAAKNPSRRTALRHLAKFVAASPLAAQDVDTQESESIAVISPPAYDAEIMAPINLHEFEDVARRKLNRLAFDYVAGGAADELTMTANREAFDRFWIRRRIMKDVSAIDTSLELLGQKLPHPILLAPAGAKQLLHKDGDRVSALAARHTGAIYVSTGLEPLAGMSQAGEAPTWWAATLGQAERAPAEDFARRAEDSGAAAICVSVDYPYTAARDRNARNQFDMDSITTGVFSTPDVPRDGFQAGMLQPYTPSMTWEYVGWLHGGTKLPVIVKGIVTAEDARIAVENGADMVIVSNHGGRTLDGMLGTLDALPEVVEAVSGRVPVLVDGGVRRGGDVLKALSLGASAILIGRPYLWALGSFGQEGVQRVVELLHGELRVAMGLAGVASLADIDRSLVRRAWKG